MKKSKVLLVLLLGLFVVFSSCEKKEIEPEKKISKLDYIKQLTGNDNFFITYDKINDDIIRDSLNGVLYRYYPDINNKNHFQNIIISTDSIDNFIDKYNYDKRYWIEVINIATLYAIQHPDGFELNCLGVQRDCANISLFGVNYILC